MWDKEEGKILQNKFNKLIDQKLIEIKSYRITTISYSFEF